MKLLKFNILLLILMILSSKVIAQSNVVFIDIDFLIKNSNTGKLLLEQIEEINLRNINELKNKELTLKKNEEEINKKKNIISQEELNKEINLLKIKIKEFNIQKDKMINDFNQYKNAELNKLLDQFNVVINEFVTNNSIDIVLNKKSIYMGKRSSDITEVILKKIDK